MLNQSIVPWITKKAISYSLVLQQQPLITLQIQNFDVSISMYPKTIKII